MNKFRLFLKNNLWIMRAISFMYNLLNLNNSWKYCRHNQLNFRGAFLKKCYFDIKYGRNNIIMIKEGCRLSNCRFTVTGNNCSITIKGIHTIISNVHFWCQNDHSSIEIGSDFTMEGGHIASTGGRDISIGHDCMFSNDVEIRNGDSHPIIDINSSERINWEESVKIGNHVWLTAHTRVLKGSVIPSNSIIGNSSIVTSVLEKENAIYIGNKLVKENIFWTRKK